MPIEDCSMFKTALLVHKFLLSGYPIYFEPFLKPRHSGYNTCRSLADGVVLEALHTWPHQYISLLSILD